MRLNNNAPALISIIVLLLVFGATSLNFFQLASGQDQNLSTIIYVDASNIYGPWDGSSQHPFQFIQDAINVSNDHDTVHIVNGTYYKSLVITTSITLRAENTTILDGGYSPVVIAIHADHVTLMNLTIRKSGGGRDHVGILLLSNHTIVDNCTLQQTKTGIFAPQTSYHTIQNCLFANNGVGMKLCSSQNILLFGCTFGHNAIGIDSHDSSHVMVTKAYLHTNGRAGFFSRCQHVIFSHCNISDNSVNHGGVFLDRCSDVTIENSILSHNGIGVRITASKDVLVDSSTLHMNTHYAVMIDAASTKITIIKCNITDGLRFGVSISQKSSCVLLHNNIFSHMLYAVFMVQSECRLQYNYWGASQGPSPTFFGPGERINVVLPRIRSYPWLMQPIHDAGAHWTVHEPYLNRTVDIISPRLELVGQDSDGDGAPDWWELKWGYDPLIWEDHFTLDPDGDGLTNIEECYMDAYGADPFKKDIFLEIDWMTPTNQTGSYKPTPELIRQAQAAFEQQGISLHIDVGDIGGGEEIPYRADFTFSELVDIYWEYFLGNDPTSPRKGIFRYVLLCDKGPDVNFPFMGWDHLDSILISTGQLSKQMPLKKPNHIALYATIHQLGHTLGLLADIHPGIDNVLTLYPFTMQWLMYRNYQSTMNYYYKYRTFSYSDGTHGPGDFDDYAHLNFSFFKNTSFR